MHTDIWALPELAFPDEFLHKCLQHPDGLHGWKLTPSSHDCTDCTTPPFATVCFTGFILRNIPHDRIYRIAEYHCISNSWWARWPD